MSTSDNLNNDSTKDNFVYMNEDSIDENLICEICARPFIDPIEHVMCGHTFCLLCVQGQRKCPQCRKETDENSMRPVISRALLRPLGELRVKCSTCKKYFARTELAKHVQKCPTDCPFGCNDKVMPEDYVEHEKKCPGKVLACPAADLNCTWNGPRRELEAHLNGCIPNQLGTIIRGLQEQSQQAQNQIRQLKEEIQTIRQDALKPKPSEIRKITLNPVWINYQDQTQPGIDRSHTYAAYSKDNTGRVYLQGLIVIQANKIQADGHTLIGNLPIGYRPVMRHCFFFAQGKSSWRIDVYIDGRIVMVGNEYNYIFTLDGINFLTS